MVEYYQRNCNKIWGTKRMTQWGQFVTCVCTARCLLSACLNKFTHSMNKGNCREYRNSFCEFWLRKFYTRKYFDSKYMPNMLIPNKPGANAKKDAASAETSGRKRKQSQIETSQDDLKNVKRTAVDCRPSEEKSRSFFKSYLRSYLRSYLSSNLIWELLSIS